MAKRKECGTAGNTSSEKKKEQKQTIKCDVESCTYNDNDNNCQLDEIKVSCNCSNNDVSDKEETICNSFEAE